MVLQVTMIGVHYEDNHVATGFGNHLARPILREEWNENLTFEEGVKLLEKCMRVLLYRDRSISCEQTPGMVIFGIVCNDDSFLIVCFNPYYMLVFRIISFDTILFFLLGICLYSGWFFFKHL